jgi:hypothetical protein
MASACSLFVVPEPCPFWLPAVLEIVLLIDGRLVTAFFNPLLGSVADVLEGERAVLGLAS